MGVAEQEPQLPQVGERVAKVGPHPPEAFPRIGFGPLLRSVVSAAEQRQGAGRQCGDETDWAARHARYVLSTGAGPIGRSHGKRPDQRGHHKGGGMHHWTHRHP
jgi:hypothetical protein